MGLFGPRLGRRCPGGAHQGPRRDAFGFPILNFRFRGARRRRRRGCRGRLIVFSYVYQFYQLFEQCAI